MPMKYDPDTGIPSYVTDLGQEIEEGVTPKPTVIDTKAGVFKGDKRLTKDGYDMLRDGLEPIDATPTTADMRLERAIRNAKPAELDARIATDEEVDELEKLAASHSVLHWPLILRLVNRIRRAERR